MISIPIPIPELELELKLNFNHGIELNPSLPNEHEDIDQYGSFATSMKILTNMAHLQYHPR